MPRNGDPNGAGQNGRAPDEVRRRLQRIVREPPLHVRDVARDDSPRSTPQQVTAPQQARLSPQLVNPAASVPDTGIQFQCTECDMMVKESDPYCPFCGAIFADGPLSAEDETAETEAEEPPAGPRPPERIEHVRPEVTEHVRPEKFDVFGIMNTRGKARELLYQEAMKGFAGSARLLEEIEHQIADVSSLGNDTTRARRLMSSAWEACREGDWNLVSALARQTEEVMAPSIPALVRSELAKAREHLMDAKAACCDVSEYLLRMKAAMHCLKCGDDDEALRLTKELVDLLRQDSVAWRAGRTPVQRGDLRSGR